MSPVIKVYVFIPLPILITDKPVKEVPLKWITNLKRNHQPKLSVSLLKYLNQQASVRTAWRN